MTASMAGQGSTAYYITPASLVQVQGRDRVDLLQRLCTNDLRPLQRDARCISTLFTTHQGRLVDWVQVLAHPSDAAHIWLRASPGRAPALAAWIDTYTIMEDVQSQDISTQWLFCALTGSHAAAFAGLQTWPEPAALAEGREGSYWYRGLAAYGERLEGVVPAAHLARLIAHWDEAGAHAWDDSAAERARLQAGVPSPAYEFAEQVNPLELRLTAHAVGWNKGCYIGQEVISRLDSYDKVARLLVGFTAPAGVDIKPGDRLTMAERPIGRVTSASAADGQTLGLAIVKREVADGEHDAVLASSAGAVPVRLQQRPFFQQ